MSTRSFGLPDASLSAIRSSIPKIDIFSPFLVKAFLLIRASRNLVRAFISVRRFEDQISDAIHSLGKRYPPDVNFRLPIFEISDSFSQNTDFKKKFDKVVGGIFKARRSVYHAVENSFLAGQQVKIDQCLNSLRDQYLLIEFSGFKLIDFDQLTGLSGLIEQLLQECLKIL